MADSYWIDVHQGNRMAAGKHNKLGADDYQIAEGVGGHGGSGRSGYHRGGSRWQTPLFYVIDNAPVGVVVTADDQDVPDEVTGTGGDRLSSGESMRAQNGTGKGFSPPLLSRNNRARLFLQADSNLVLYDGPPEKGRWLWTSGPSAGCNTLTMQTDGNLVLSNAASGQPGWNSGTPGHPGGYLVIGDDGQMALYDAQGAYWAAGTNGFKRSSGTPWYRGKTSGVLNDAIHVFNEAASYAGKAVGSIPGVGPLAAAAATLNPIAAIGGLVTSVASGERLDHAFLDAAKSQIASAREVAPYVQTVMAVVPGVGTGVAAAIAAGTALAEGRTITDAVISGIRGALPGGALSQAAFDGISALAHGQSLTSAAIGVAMSHLPASAQAALKSIAGKANRAQVIQAVRNALPLEQRKAADIAVATAVARNVQSATVNAVTKPAVVANFAAHGTKVIKAVPRFAQIATHLTPEERKGFDAAMGLLGHRGVNAQTLVAMRARMPKAQQLGFDRACKVYSDHFTPHHPSLVHRGLVLRGNWVPARSGEKNALVGRLIQSGKVTHGIYKRV